MQDTTIRLKDPTKKKLEHLDFVGKRHSYNDIIEELIQYYNNKNSN